MNKAMRKLMDAYGIVVRTRQLHGARAMVVHTKTGFTIVVNDQLSPEVALKAMAHEVLHIILGHFSDRRHLTEAEKESEVNRILGQ